MPRRGHKRVQSKDDHYFYNDEPPHTYGYNEELNNLLDEIAAGLPDPRGGTSSNNTLDFPMVIDQQHRLPNSRTQTETQTESYSGNNNSMAGGRYAGKVKAHARAKQNRRASKLIYEESGHVYDYNCVYIGHTTMDPRRSMYVVCFGLIRALLAHAGYDTNVSTAFGFDINAVFQFKYRPTPVGASMDNVDFLTMVNGTPKSIETIANELWTSLNSTFNSNPNAVITSLNLLPRTDFTGSGGTNVSSSVKSISLSTSTIYFDVISSLKVQNTTKHLNISGTTEQEEATAVDAAPLVGMIYSGPGQGTWSKSKDDATPYLISAGGSSSGGSQGINGVICAIANTNKSFQEPPNPDQLMNVRKWSGVKFQPGDLKVSRLVTRKSMPVGTLVNRLGRLHASLYWSNAGLGQFSVLALEKMIGLKGANDEDNPAVEIDFEVNQEYSVYVKVKNDYSTPQLFNKAESRTIGPV